MEGNLVPPANELNDVEEQHLNAENNQNASGASVNDVEPPQCHLKKLSHLPHLLTMIC